MILNRQKIINKTLFGNVFNRKMHTLSQGIKAAQKTLPNPVYGPHCDKQAMQQLSTLFEKQKISHQLPADFDTLTDTAKIAYVGKEHMSIYIKCIIANRISKNTQDLYESAKKFDAFYPPLTVKKTHPEYKIQKEQRDIAFNLYMKKPRELVDEDIKNFTADLKLQIEFDIQEPVERELKKALGFLKKINENLYAECNRCFSFIEKEIENKNVPPNFNLADWIFFRNWVTDKDHDTAKTPTIIIDSEKPTSIEHPQEIYPALSLASLAGRLLKISYTHGNYDNTKNPDVLFCIPLGLDDEKYMQRLVLQWYSPPTNIPNYASNYFKHMQALEKQMANYSKTSPQGRVRDASRLTARLTHARAYINKLYPNLWPENLPENLDDNETPDT
jgi:hypothetical protein